MAETPTKTLQLRPRERWLAILAVLVIGGWGFVSWLAQPLWDHIADLRERVETQTRKLNALSALLQTAPNVEHEYQQVAGYLVNEGDDQAQSQLLTELESLARTSAVQLNLKPRPPKREERLRHLEVEVDAEGPPDAILGFLDRVITLPKLIAVQRLRIASAPTTRQLRANLVIEQILPIQ